MSDITVAGVQGNLNANHKNWQTSNNALEKVHDQINIILLMLLIIIVIFVVMNDDDYHQCIFSEWSSLDLAWTSAFSLIVVTSVVGNVMVAFFQSAIFNSIRDTLDHNMLREFMVFFPKNIRF